MKKSKGNSIHSIKKTKDGALVIFKTGTVWYPKFSEIEMIKRLMTDCIFEQYGEAPLKEYELFLKEV